VSGPHKSVGFHALDIVQDAVSIGLSLTGFSQVPISRGVLPIGAT